MVSLSISELPGDRMQVRLLGPVDVTVDGQARAINGLRRTALVAALALRAGEVVSADLLTELQDNVAALEAEVARLKAEHGRTELKAVAALEAAAQRIEQLAAE